MAVVERKPSSLGARWYSTTTVVPRALHPYILRVPHSHSFTANVLSIDTFSTDTLNGRRTR